MDALFWDRKNRRQVRLSQLVPTRCVVDLVQADPQDPPRSWDDTKPDDAIGWDDEGREVVEKGAFPGRITFWGLEWRLAYKSEKCPTFQNHDLCCNPEDLVLLDVLETDSDPGYRASGLRGPR
jgi:hypothetical protein